ncbi:MAG: uridylate kinase, partial [Methanomicrobium sp.]|nr:uridylate kinase [Methanomicrobium sp.]
ISFECGQIELLVKYGIVPVLHGDVVMDEGKGACIISGDQLVSYLASCIHADRIGLATDVPGVLKDGKVIPVINAKSAGSLDINESKNTDVTGGMRGKITELLMLAEKGIESSIFHVSRTGDFLDGRDHGGTIVSARTDTCKKRN